MLLFTSCMLITLSVDLVGGMGTCEALLHKLGNTLKFYISLFFKNNVCMLLGYSTRKFGIQSILI